MSDNAKIAGSYAAATVASIYYPAGAAYFFAAAGIVTAYITRPGPVHGAKLGDTAYSGSAYGVPITRGWGTFPAQATYIWAPKLKERKKTDQAGKGGQEVITYTYSASFAVLLCEGPVDAVRRIWFDTKLVYDASSTNAEAFVHKKLNIQIYLGSATQGADPTIEAKEGAGQVPGYRGYCYFVVDDYPLDKHGNRRPNVRAEIVKDTSIIDTTASIGPDGSCFDLHYSPIDDTIVSRCTNATYRFDPVTKAVISTSPAYTGLVSVYDIDPYTGTIYGAGHPDGNHFWPVNLSQFEGGTAAGYWPTGTDLTEPQNTGQLKEIIYQEYNDTVAYLILTGVFQGKLTFWPDHSDIYSISNTFTDPDIDIIWFKIDEEGHEWAFGSANGSYSDSVFIDDYEYNFNTLFSITDPSRCQWHVPTQSMLIQHSAGISRVSITNDTAHPYTLVKETNTVDGTLFYQESKRWLYDNYIWVKDDTLTFRQMDVISMTWTSRSSITFSVIDGDQVYHKSTNTIWTGKQSSADIWTVQLDRVPPDQQALSVVVSDLCRDMETSQFDVTDLSQNVDGFIITQPEQSRGTVARLFPTHNFGAVESDGKIKFVHYPKNPVVTIPEDDLAAHVYGSTTPSPINITRAQEIEFPKRVEVTYISRKREYENDTQGSGKQITPSTKISKVSLVEVLTANRAKQLSEIYLHTPRDERNTHTFQLSNKYLYLDPMDEVNLTKGNITHRVRITKIDYSSPGILKCTGLSTDPASFTSTAVGSDPDYPSNTVDNLRGSIPWLLDMPLVSTVENIHTPGFYVGTSSDQGDWDGASIVRSTSTASADIESLAAADVEVTAGYASTTLADVTLTTVWDNTNTVTVAILEGTLSSSTDADVLNGANAAMLGSELIQFVNVTDHLDGTYTLSRLLRGRRGTEWATDSHSTNDQFVLLTNESIYNVYTTLATMNIEHYYRAVTFGLDIFDTAPYPFTNTNIRLKPFSPTQPDASLSGSDVTLTAVRRTRLLINPAVTPVPLGEEIEEYELDIKDVDGNVLRTVTGLTSLSYLYTSANQTIDYGGSPSIIYGSWYQLSNAIGRGYPLDFDTSDLLGILPKYNDFSSYTTGQAATDWTQYSSGWNKNCLVTADTSQYSYAATGNWLEFDGGAAFPAIGWWNDTDQHADVEVLMEFDNVNTGGFDQILLLRSTIEGPTYQHYGLGYVQSTTSLEFRYKTSSGSWSTSGYTGTRTKTLGADLTRPAKTFYRYRIVGDKHQAKVWQTSLASEPAAWDLDATHTSISAAGQVGIHILANSATFPISQIAVAYDGATASFS